jgi:hypothetical protein
MPTNYPPFDPIDTARDILQTAVEMAETAKLATDPHIATFCRQAARRLYWSALHVIERADPADAAVAELAADAARLDRLLTDSVA